MRIGVMSDSHGIKMNIDKALEIIGEVDVFFHLGDEVKDGAYLRSLTNVPVHIVNGNMDLCYSNGHDSILTVIGDKKIFACHGHHFGVKHGLENLHYKALEVGADIVLFGHTHLATVIENDNIIMLNPGSVSLPHFGQSKSFGVVTITNGKIDTEIGTF